MIVGNEQEEQVRAAGEDRMLLAEMVHRTANEATSALAAVHLAKAARGWRARRRLLDQASARLEGFAVVNGALAVSFSRAIDVGLVLERLIHSIASGRSSRDERIVLDLREVHLEAAQARRVLLVGYELVSNAMRHVIEVDGGLLSVVLRYDAEQVVLMVSDDGPGLATGSSTSGTGLGSKLVTDLVRSAAGRLECFTGRNGTTFRVLVPARGPASNELPCLG